MKYRVSVYRHLRRTVNEIVASRIVFDYWIIKPKKSSEEYTKIFTKTIRVKDTDEVLPSNDGSMRAMGSRGEEAAEAFMPL